MERQLYFYDYVDRTASDIRAMIESHALDVFQTATDRAVEETGRFRSRLHVDIAGFEIGRQVEIELGKADDRGYAVCIPIKWRAKDQAGLFPAMHADLEIVALGDNPPLTQIGLMGRYRPPAGLLGAAGDALLMHRVAEASVRRFVTELASRLRGAAQTGTQ